MGSYEIIPNLKSVDYDLKRTSKGFELHNANDNNKRRLVADGLVLKFEKIAELKAE